MADDNTLQPPQIPNQLKGLSQQRKQTLEISKSKLFNKRKVSENLVNKNSQPLTDSTILSHSYQNDMRINLDINEELKNIESNYNDQDNN